MAEKKGLNVRSSKDNKNKESSKTLYNGDKRLGFVNKYQSADDPRRTTYNVGIDNTGSPYRGVVDRSINTPLGRIGYGYDGDTSFANITPPTMGRTDLQYPNYQYRDTYIDNIAGMYPELYESVYKGTPTYGAAIEGFPVSGNGWGTANTPFGTISGGLSDDRVLGAEISPNEKTQYYIQALANLLYR